MTKKAEIINRIAELRGYSVARAERLTRELSGSDALNMELGIAERDARIAAEVKRLSSMRPAAAWEEICQAKEGCWSASRFRALSPHSAPEHPSSQEVAWNLTIAAAVDFRYGWPRSAANSKD